MSQIDVKTSYNKDTIISEMTLTVGADQLDLISREVADLRDEGVRKALIDLGWTPPAVDLADAPQAKDAPYQRRVVCAANRYTRPGVGTGLVLGARHFDTLMHGFMVSLGWSAEQRHCPDKDQGFIDQHGVFMTRKEAWTVAAAAGQIRFRCGGDGERLYSENLY